MIEMKIDAEPVNDSFSRPMYFQVDPAEIERVNFLLALFRRYVEHICSEEGTNYARVGVSLTEKESDTLDLIAKGHLDD